MHDYDYTYNTRHVLLFLASSPYRSLIIYNYRVHKTISQLITARARDLAPPRSLVIYSRKKSYKTRYIPNSELLSKIHHMPTRKLTIKMSTHVEHTANTIIK